MTTKIDTAVPQPKHSTSTQSVAMTEMAETYQATVQQSAGTDGAQFVVQADPYGPVFVGDTEGSVSARTR